MRGNVSVVGVLVLGVGVVVVPPAVAVARQVPCDTPSLVKAVGDANAAGKRVRLSLAGGCTYRVDRAIGDNGFPVVTGDVELVGAGTVISRHPAAPRFRFFRVAVGGRLGIEGLVVTGGHTRDGLAPGGSGGDGGAVHSSGELVIGRSTLSGNRTGDGAVGVIGADGNLDTARGGGGGHGGAVFSDGIALRISKSDLKGNSTGRGGWGAHGLRGKDNAADAEQLRGGPGGEGGWGGDGGAIANHAGVFELLHSSVEGNRTGAGGPGGASGRGGDNANGPGGDGARPVSGGPGGSGGAIDLRDSEVNVQGGSATGNTTGDGGPAGRAGDGGNGVEGGKGGGRAGGRGRASGGDGGSGGALSIRPITPGERTVTLFGFEAKGNRTGNGGNGGDGGFGVPGLQEGHGGSGGRGGNGGGLHVARRGPVHLTLDYFVHNATGAGGRGGLSPAPDIPDAGPGNRGVGGAIDRESLTTEVTLNQVYFTDNDPDNCRDIPGC